MNALSAVALAVMASQTAEHPVEAGTHRPAPQGREAEIDVLLQPFAWQELLRTDLRLNSPITQRTTLVTVGAPLPMLPGRAALLLQYRNDLLHDALNGGLAAFSGRSLHFVELGLPVNLPLGRRWALNFDPRVSYAGDYEVPSAEGIGGSLRVGATWKAADELALSLAVIAPFHDPVPLPVLGVYWRPKHQRFRIEGLLPRYAEVSVGLVGELSWFGMFHFEGNRWITPNESEGDTPTDLRRTEVRLQSGFRVTFFGPIGFELSGQWIPVQELRVNDGPAVAADAVNDFALTLGLGLLNL